MTEYQSNRGGKKKFLRDLVPGKTYYSIEDAKQPWGDGRYYKEWVFKKSRLWVGTCGHMSAEYVLSNYGPLYDKKPSGMSNLLGKPKQLHRPFGSDYEPYDEQTNRETNNPKRRARAGR